MLLTLPIRDVLPATPRSRIARIDLESTSFSYLPGQAVLVGAHEQDKRRPYSLAAAPEDASRDRCLELLIGVNDDGTPGSHLTLRAGALVDVEGPLGRFTFPAEPETDRFVFIAGGSGIAPLRSMLHHALHGPHQNISVLYSARTLNDFAYGEELQGLAREGRIQLKQTVTRDAGEDWSGARGRLGSSELASLGIGRDSLCFICGPPALVHEIPKLLAERGVPPSFIRIEEWG